MFRELFTAMTQEIQKQPHIKKYKNAAKMNDLEKEISFWNRYFIFQKRNNNHSFPVTGAAAVTTSIDSINNIHHQQQPFVTPSGENKSLKDLEVVVSKPSNPRKKKLNILEEVIVVKKTKV